MKRVNNILPHWTETMICTQGEWELALTSTEDVWFCHKISYGSLLQEARLGNSYHSRYLLWKLIYGVSLQVHIEQTAFHRLIEVKWRWLPEESFITVLCDYRTASYRINQVALKKPRASFCNTQVFQGVCNL